MKLLTQHARSALAVGAHGGACTPEIRLRCDCTVQVGAVFGERARIGGRGRGRGWCRWRWVRRGAVPAFDRWHVGLSKLHRRLAISLLHGVAGLTAGVANRPLENDRQTRRSPRPARHEKHKRTKADRRWRDSLSKDAMRVATPGCRWCGSGGIIAMEGTRRILIFVRRALSFGRRAKSPTHRARSSSSRAKSPTRRAPSSDSRAKSLARRAPSSGSRAKSFTRRAPSSGSRAKSLTHRAPSSGSRAKSLTHRAPSSGSRAKSSTRRALSSDRRERLSMCRVVKAASDHSDSSSETAFWHCGAALQRPISRPRALDGTA